MPMQFSFIPKQRAVQICAVAAAALFSAATAFSHVFWIHPSAFRPKANDLIKYQLLVGDGGIIEAKPRDASRIIKFASFDPTGKEHEVLGRDGHDPAGFDRLQTPGTHLVVYHSNNAFVSMTAEKFAKYLSDEGVENIIKARETSKPEGTAPDAMVREAYSRCAKALICVDEKPTPNFNQVIGLPLEIIPVTDPYAAKVSDRLTFRVLLHGKPYNGATLFAARPTGPALTQRPDEKGEATFKLDMAGTWLINIIAMHEAPQQLPHQTPATVQPPQGASKDGIILYESIWASLAFSLGSDSPPPAITTVVPPQPSASLPLFPPARPASTNPAPVTLPITPPK